VRKDLDSNIKNKLKTALLQMHLDDEGKEVLMMLGAKRFIETRDDDYKPVYDLVKRARIDPKRYYYINK
jgi:ABC-type phosphate/phosphonate transport system substrate-binding protein